MAVYGQGRYFFGNSFNLFSGLGYRSATIDYKIADSSYEISGKISAQSITIPVFIGNAWAWSSGFTFGVDWIGVFIPIGGTSKSSLSGNLPSSVATDLNDELLKLGNKLAKSSSLTLFLMSIGWAF